MTTPTRRIRHRKAAAIAAAAFAVLAVAIPVGAGSAAPLPAAPVAAQPASAAKPTIVLVHGAWADGSSFAPETAALQLAGYKVLVAPNPLRGVVNDTKVLADFLAQKTTGPVVLAAHSYGGVVITGAALTDPDVKALVYIDAYAPDVNESASALTNSMPGSLLNVPDLTTVFDFVVPAADATIPQYDAYIKVDRFKEIFAASLPSVITNPLAAAQSPAVVGALGTPFTGTPAWKTIPSFFFIGTADKVIPPAEQRFMAQRAHGTIVEANAPHLSMLDEPLKVTKLIIQAASSVK